MKYEITVLAYPDGNHPATLADRCTVEADDTAAAARAYAALFAATPSRTATERTDSG